MVSWYRRLAGGMVGWMVGRLVEDIGMGCGMVGWMDGFIKESCCRGTNGGGRQIVVKPGKWKN